MSARLRALLVVAAVGCAACGSGDDDGGDAGSSAPTTTENTATTAAAATSVEPVETTDEVDIEASTTVEADRIAVELAVESGFSTEVDSIGTRNTTAGAVITNPSPDEAACEVQVTFSLQDASGAPVDTTTETVAWVPKSGRVIVAPTLVGFDIPQEPTALVVTTVVGDFKDTDDLAGCDTFTMESGTMLEVTAPTVQRDEFWTSVTGQVTNTSAELVQTSFLDCVLRAGGTIVGGVSTAILDPIQPAQTIAFDSGPISAVPDTADTAECQLVAASDETGGGSGDVELGVESGFSTVVDSIGTRNTTAGAVITNPSPDEAACEVQVTFSLQDASGAPVDTTTETVAWVPKSGRVIVAPTLVGFDIPQEPTALVVTTVVGDFKDTDDLAGCDTFTIESGTMLEVTAPTVQRDEFWTSVTGQVTNTSAELVQTSFLDCVLRAGGTIVGGASTAILDPIQPAQTIAFDSGPISAVPDTADTAECQAAAAAE